MIGKLKIQKLVAKHIDYSQFYAFNMRQLCGVSLLCKQIQMQLTFHYDHYQNKQNEGTKCHHVDSTVFWSYKNIVQTSVTQKLIIEIDTVITII